MFAGVGEIGVAAGSGVGALAAPIGIALSAQGIVEAGAGATIAIASAGNFGGDFQKFQCEKKEPNEKPTKQQLEKAAERLGFTKKEQTTRICYYDSIPG